MSLHRAVRLVAAGLGAVLIAGAVVAVTASAAGFMAGTPTTKPTPRTAYCDDFVNHLASDLGKSPDQVRSAAAQAAAQTIDDAVRNGEMTQSQADAAKKKASASDACPPSLSGIGRPEPGVDFGAAYVAAEATALGISRDELIADLKQKGMSLHQIADSKGISQDQYKAAYIAALKAQFDADVQAGKLTQKQEDQILARVQSDPVANWDHPPPAAKKPKA